MSKKQGVNDILKLLKQGLKESKERDIAILGEYNEQYKYIEERLNWIKEEREFLKQYKADIAPDTRKYTNRLIRETIRDTAESFGKEIGIINLAPKNSKSTEYWLSKSAISMEQLSVMRNTREEDFEIFDSIMQNAGGFYAFKRKYPPKVAELAIEYNVNIQEYEDWLQDKEIRDYEMVETARMEKAREQTKAARQTKKIKKTVGDIDELLKQDKRKK
ncbi:MAG: hypothetical protein ACRCUM_02360 [Mycoplasmoidaceae bacterium]